MPAGSVVRIPASTSDDVQLRRLAAHFCGRRRHRYLDGSERRCRIGDAPCARSPRSPETSAVSGAEGRASRSALRSAPGQPAGTSYADHVGQLAATLGRRSDRSKYDARRRATCGRPRLASTGDRAPNRAPSRCLARRSQSRKVVVRTSGCGGEGRPRTSRRFEGSTPRNLRSHAMTTAPLPRRGEQHRGRRISTAPIESGRNVPQGGSADRHESTPGDRAARRRAGVRSFHWCALGCADHARVEATVGDRSASTVASTAAGRARRATGRRMVATARRAVDDRSQARTASHPRDDRPRTRDRRAPVDARTIAAGVRTTVPVDTCAVCGA